MQDPWYSTPTVWSFVTATIAFGAFALLLSLRWRGEVRSSLLLAAVVLSALWAASAAAYGATPAAAMWRTSVTFDLLRLVALQGFVYLLLRGEAQISGQRPGPALPVGVAVIAATLLLIGYPSPGVSESAGRSFLVPFAAMVTLSVLGLALVEQLFRRTPGALRWNVRPLCLGLGALFAFDLVIFTDALLFRQLDDNLWVARALAQTLVIPMLGVAAARNREWTFDVSMSRGIVLGSTALAGAAVYLLVIAALGYLVQVSGGAWGTTLASALGFGALLLLAFVAASSTFRSKLRVLVAKNLLAHRYDYREEWLKFTQLVSNPTAGRPLRERCLLALGELVETSSAALWLHSAGEFAQVAQVAQPSVADRQLPADDLPAFLQATGWVVDVDEARRDPRRYRGLQLPAWLRSHPNAWLVVPLLSADVLVGFVLLGRPRVTLPLDWEVLDLLKTAGRQTAGYLAQEAATEALLEARKFESFNRMSAFVVHDLKNLVAQLQLMLRNAERHHNNPDFQRDMLETVGNVVARMNGLMQQLRAGETPVDRPHAVDLCAVIHGVQKVRAAGRCGLEVRCEGRPLVLGHADRLERVIGHLVQNAFEAVRELNGSVARVRVSVDRRGDTVVLEVADNGVGMSAQFIHERLFKPFSSSKQNGMGIGTYESRQYIQGIGGGIEVDSEPLIGTTFRVTLRAADSMQAQPEADA